MRRSLRLRLVLFLPFAFFMSALFSANANELDLAAYRGKVIYLDFWASWCNPCRQSFPWMNNLKNAYRDNGLVVIGVNVDHDRDLADGFLHKVSADFDIVFDPEGKIARRFDFRDMPTAILIDRSGRVRYVHAGFFPEKQGEYLAHIRTLLSDKRS